MASYSFAGPAGGVSGFGGGGSIWGSDWGSPIMQGLQTGFDLSQLYRTLESQQALDPSLIAAAKAQADSQRLNADILSSQSEGQLSALARRLKAQQQPQGQVPGQTPETAAITAANDQAMQDQQMNDLVNTGASRAIYGDKQGMFGINQMLRMPQYSLEMPGFGGGGGYGY